MKLLPCVVNFNPITASAPSLAAFLSKSSCACFVKLSIAFPTILGLALDVSEVWLMGYDVPMERKTAPIPMEEDERSKEFVELFNQLSTEQKKAVLYVMKGFLEKQ